MEGRSFAGLGFGIGLERPAVFRDHFHGDGAEAGIFSLDEENQGPDVLLLFPYSRVDWRCGFVEEEQLGFHVTVGPDGIDQHWSS